MSPARRRRPTIVAVGRGPAIAAVAGGLLALLSVACGDPPAPPAPVGSPPARSAAVALPAPQPVADGPCRYLSAAAVQDANGERVSAVRVSETGPDRPHPACFFLTANGAVQLRTWIVVATPEVARATVDAAAPVATSDLAELPGGWSGGSQPTADGAVFAVSRQGTAVVITTNQRQTISARQVAGQVIVALGL
ncbi:MAG: DUF2020 domain-containing protein [Pseudonocardiales bacterium]|nr:DUF2020 domain-containing protein [Pseudonocardiales bacterium]MBV9032020.1 DUF2020 domain-containing protein [Pseudonocardiales bacterium]MBW0011118.1 DUF2020 domain-containing protein [Pseudonocardiales bacterium]